MHQRFSGQMPDPGRFQNTSPPSLSRCAALGHKSHFAELQALLKNLESWSLSQAKEKKITIAEDSNPHIEMAKPVLKALKRIETRLTRSEKISGTSAARSDIFTPHEMTTGNVKYNCCALLHRIPEGYLAGDFDSYHFIYQHPVLLALRHPTTGADGEFPRYNYLRSIAAFQQELDALHDHFDQYGCKFKMLQGDKTIPVPPARRSIIYNLHHNGFLRDHDSFGIAEIVCLKRSVITDELHLTLDIEDQLSTTTIGLGKNNTLSVKTVEGLRPYTERKPTINKPQQYSRKVLAEALSKEAQLVVQASGRSIRSVKEAVADSEFREIVNRQVEPVKSVSSLTFAGPVARSTEGSGSLAPVRIRDIHGKCMALSPSHAFEPYRYQSGEVVFMLETGPQEANKRVIYSRDALNEEIKLINDIRTLIYRTDAGVPYSNLAHSILLRAVSAESNSEIERQHHTSENLDIHRQLFSLVKDIGISQNSSSATCHLQMQTGLELDYLIKLSPLGDNPNVGQLHIELRRASDFEEKCFNAGEWWDE